MASPASHDTTEETFESHRDTWRAETNLMSNVSQRCRHPRYRKIVAMGNAAIPLILRDLVENGPDDWFWALTEITGENPISEAIAGDMVAMTEAWLRWGKEKGYLTDFQQTSPPTSPDSPSTE